jgi:hypothetical protein
MNTIGSENTSEKQHRTSPRINVCNTIIAALTEGMSVNDIKAKIVSIRDNPPEAIAKSGTGSHYVVVSADNTRSHIQSLRVPNKSDTVSACYGPFHTKKGAEYVVNTGIRASDKRVF